MKTFTLIHVAISLAGILSGSQLRAVMGYLQVATVQNQVQLSLMTDFENFNVFKPAEHHEKSVNAMLDQLIAWAGALKTLRGKAI